jgi:hypothetical protein
MRLGLLSIVLLATAINVHASSVSAVARASATIIAPVMVNVANTANLSVTAIDLRRGYVDLRQLTVGSRGATGGYQLSASMGGSATGATLSRTDGGTREERLSIAGTASGQPASTLYLTVNNY